MRARDRPSASSAPETEQLRIGETSSLCTVEGSRGNPGTDELSGLGSLPPGSRNLAEHGHTAPSPRNAAQPLGERLHAGSLLAACEIDAERCGGLHVDPAVLAERPADPSREGLSAGHRGCFLLS